MVIVNRDFPCCGQQLRAIPSPEDTLQRRCHRCGKWWVIKFVPVELASRSKVRMFECVWTERQ